MHYKDGQEVKLGDLVRGKPYNTPREVVGEVVGLVPGTEACNLRVAFLEVRYLARNDKGETVLPFAALSRPQMALGGSETWQGSQQPETVEPPASLWPCVDYAGTQDFELIARSR